MQEEGLKLLKKVGEKTGMPVVTEVMNTTDVDLIGDYSDILQIGARNVQNFALLKKVGRSRRPVLLKRGMMTTIEELLMSAEYILSEGNAQVILCERGIRTFETATRNTLDISAVPVLKRTDPPAGDRRSEPRLGPREVRDPPHPCRRGRRGGRRRSSRSTPSRRRPSATVRSRSGRSSSTGSWTRSDSSGRPCAAGSGGSAMKTMKVNLDGKAARSYEIHIGTEILDRMGMIVAMRRWAGRYILVTDENVARPSRRAGPGRTGKGGPEGGDDRGGPGRSLQEHSHAAFPSPTG